MNLLLLQMGNSATEVLDTFTKREILLQILKKIKYGPCTLIFIISIYYPEMPEYNYLI